MNNRTSKKAVDKKRAFNNFHFSSLFSYHISNNNITRTLEHPFTLFF